MGTKSGTSTKAMIESLRIENDRGLHLSALLHCPDCAAKAPAILVLHGFTGFKEETHMQRFAEDLEASGFVAIRFDASGFGESEGTIEDDFRVSHYLQDIQAVFRFVAAHPAVDANRIGICGHSLGAGLSIIAASQNPGIKACCAVQPSRVTMEHGSRYDLKSWKETGWYEQSCEHTKYASIRLPWAFAEDRNRFDAREAVKELKIPLMIMYGTADQTVDPKTTRSVFENATCPKEIVELRGFDHHFKNVPAHLGAVSSILVNFFSTNLA